MKIVMCEQGTEAWWTAKKGRPSASNFDKIMSPVKMKFSDSAEKYADELIADMHSLTPVGVESYTSRAMQNGVDSEPAARAWYQVERDVDVVQVGTCITDDDRFCCSPDALVTTDPWDRSKPVPETFAGGLELKCPLTKTQVGYLLSGELPREYVCQAHGQLLVTGLPWVDFMSYCPGVPVVLIRVTPNEVTDALRVALELFWEMFQERLEAYRKIEQEKGVAAR